MRFKLGRLSNYVYLRNLPIENGRSVSVAPQQVESLQAVRGKTWVRMGSGILYVSPLPKREVAKLLGAKVK